MLKGFADEHVLYVLVEALRRRGMDVVRVQDCGLQTTPDSDLLDKALADERVMLSNDTDFLRIAAQRSADQQAFAPIFFWPQQQRTVAQILNGIVREASQHKYTDACSRVFYL
ncbi:MAG: DUF5615 family PIN-like protein [Planctomycetales bacterium]|nr:DUF5615 family PIN-like protein [Planctomycetales bacterium]